MARFQAGPIKGFYVLPLSTSILLIFNSKNCKKERITPQWEESSSPPFNN
jgi:hypothetical protein